VVVGEVGCERRKVPAAAVRGDSGSGGRGLVEEPVGGDLGWDIRDGVA
jgi:hypothetical protein